MVGGVIRRGGKDKIISSKAFYMLYAISFGSIVDRTIMFASSPAKPASVIKIIILIFFAGDSSIVPCLINTFEGFIHVRGFAHALFSPTAFFNNVRYLIWRLKHSADILPALLLA